MKKVLFAAIAVVAFSGISEANTIKDKEISEGFGIEPTTNSIQPSIGTQPSVGGGISTGAQSVPGLHIDPGFIKTLVGCLEDYNTVKATYTPLVGASQAEGIAKGVFAGCMGVLPN